MRAAGTGGAVKDMLALEQAGGITAAIRPGKAMQHRFLAGGVDLIDDTALAVWIATGEGRAVELFPDKQHVALRRAAVGAAGERVEHGLRSVGSNFEHRAHAVGAAARRAAVEV